jgi:hypothetical protein
MIRFSTSVLQATSDDHFGCTQVFSIYGTASFQSETMIGSQVGEPNETKPTIDGERSTEQSFKSLVAQKNGVITRLLTAEKQATRSSNVTLENIFHSQRSRQ